MAGGDDIPPKVLAYLFPKMPEYVFPKVPDYLLKMPQMPNYGLNIPDLMPKVPEAIASIVEMHQRMAEAVDLTQLTGSPSL